MNEILILGVGNLVLKDEGIGIHVINRMEQEGIPNGVDLLDGGTGGIFLIGTLEQYKHIIMIDATLDDYPAGTIRCIKPHYSEDYPLLLSAHEIGLKDMIDAMIIQDAIPEIDLIVVSVIDVHEIGMSLSPEVERAIPRVIRKVHEVIAEIHRKSKVAKPVA